MTIIKVKRKHAEEVGGRFLAIVGVDRFGEKKNNLRAETLMDLRQRLEGLGFFPPASWSDIEKRLDEVGIWELHPKSNDSFESLTREAHQNS